MRRLTYICPLLLLYAVIVAAAPMAKTDDLARDYRLLQHELRLARENQLYFVFDLPQQTVSFRANGVSVVALPVAGWRLWGPPRGEEVSVLADKESFDAPQRPRVPAAPANGPAAITESGNLDALEIDDMPLRYRLLLDDGTVIRVLPIPDGVLSQTLQGMRSTAWYLSRPLISDWNFLHGRPYTELVLALRPQDARLLYWSFTAGGRCLIKWPPR